MAVPISNVTRRVVYAPSGTGPYAFTFEILAQTDIAVFKGDTQLTLSTDYTVTINTNGTGSVTLVASAGTDNITIVGDRAIQRTTDFTTGGDFFANTLNTELDSLTIFAQQNAEAIARTLQAPETDPTTINMTLPRKADRAGKYLAFDAVTGDPVPGETPPEVEVLLALADEIAALGAITDEIVAVDANEANINTVAGQISPTNRIATVAGISANITTVAGISADVTTVAGNSANVTTVAGISSAVSGVAAISSAVTGVNSNSTNINAVNSNATNINTVAGISGNVTTVAGISANVTSVAGNSTNINTVAGISANVTTVAGISANVTTVAGISADVTAVAGIDSGDLAAVAAIDSDVATVAGIAAAVSTVAADGTDIGAVAAISADIQSVAAIDADVSTVAGISADVTAVAGIDALDLAAVAAIDTDITTVAGISANVTTVAGISADVTAVAGINIADLIAVADIDTEITTVAGISADITTVATNVSDITNFSDVYLGAATSNPATRNDSSALQAGDLYFNTSVTEMRVYTGSAWVAATTSPDTVVEVEFAATSGQTSYTFTGGYRIGYTYIWVNGEMLADADYTATNGTSITFTTALALNDVVRIITFKSVGSVVISDIVGLQTELDGKQPLDAGLTSIAGLTTAANKMIYTTASDVYAVADLTSAGRALLDDADAAAQRTTLGATTVGSNLFTLSNPGAIRFPRLNADNTVSALSDSDFRTAIGAGTGNGTVTSVGGTGTVNGITLTGTVTSSGSLTLGGTLSGVSLTTQVTGTLPIANGGSGQTTAQTAMNAFAGAVTSGSYLRGNGTNVLMSTIQAGDVPTLNQNTTGSAATLTTARTFQTNLASTSSASFNGSANVTPGVTGTLPVGNGGSGVTTITGVIKGNGASAFSAATAGTDFVAPGTATTFTAQQTFKEVKDTVHTITDGAGFEIDPANGSIQVVTLGASRTPAATNFEAGQVVLLGIDDGTAYTITWTTVAVTWVKAGGTASAPTLATSGYTWVLLWKVGSTIYGTEVGKP
jgi:hypothetical protein